MSGSSPTSTAVLCGAARHEFLMQAQRKAMWPLVGGLALLPVIIPASYLSDRRFPLAAAVGQQALNLNTLAPVAVGVLLADRVIRDRRLRVDELLDSLPAPHGPRLWGKYLGVVGATALPLLLAWTVAIGQLLVLRHDAAVIPLAIGAFAAIVVPGILIVAAGALAFALWLGAPLFRVLFVGYWFWGNAIPTQAIPTLAETWLTPIGGNAAIGLFGARGLFGTRLAEFAPGRLAATASITLLLGAAALIVVALHASQERRRATA